MASLLQKQCRPLPSAGSCSLCQDAMNVAVCHTFGTPSRKRQGQHATIFLLCAAQGVEATSFMFVNTGVNELWACVVTLIRSYECNN